MCAVHINTYGADSFIQPLQGLNSRDHIQAIVNLIRKAAAIPALNHPNFRWALPSKDLLTIKHLPLMEVFNGHPDVNNRGGGSFESLKQDTLLTAQKKVFGIAVDDAYNFIKFDKSMSNPARGGVVVRAATLARQEILDGIAAGDLYASTGGQLQELETSAKGIQLKVAHANYELEPGDQYERAVVHASNGDDAWVLPGERR